MRCSKVFLVPDGIAATDVVADSCSYLQPCRRTASSLKLVKVNARRRMFHELDDTVEADGEKIK